MKKFILPILLTFSTLASGQDEMVRRFARQETWQNIILQDSKMHTRFLGQLTDRDTIRINFESSVIETPFILSVENEERWIKSCNRYPYILNEETKGLELTVKENPFSPRYGYALSSDKSGKVRSIWEAENAPQSIQYRIKVLGNDLRNSSAFQIDGYNKFIKRTEDELNKQFSVQLQRFVNNETISFDLSKMTDAGCDLSLGILDIVIEVSLRAEVPRIQQFHWIKKAELETLYEELKGQDSSDIEIYRAGIQIGRAFQKSDLKVDLTRNNRDYKLLQALFKTDKNLFSLRSLSRSELTDKYYESAEVLIPKNWVEELVPEIRMTKLEIKERN